MSLETNAVDKINKVGNGLIAFFKREAKKCGFRVLECEIQHNESGKIYKKFRNGDRKNG